MGTLHNAVIAPDAFDRNRALERLTAGEFDVLVIGGGITGAGVALDAAARGLRTSLVEKDDFASGTSSRSSKLVHGGLRYLQQGDVRLVYEALAERQRLRRNAPHLVRVLPFLVPMFGKGGVIPRELARALGSAMWMYDLTGGARIGRLHKRISRDEALTHMPTLTAERLGPSYLYYDARADDARLTLAVARTAAIDHGAVVVNRAEVVGMSKDVTGRVTSVTVRCADREIEVRCRSVVNATGIWADRVRGLDEGVHRETIRPAKGVHITVPWDKVRNDIAVVIPVRQDRRSIFVVPWEDRTFIGTTDTDYEGSLDDPVCTADDVRYLLDAVNHWIEDPLGSDDVLGTWAGLRPLVSEATTARTADLSRRHKVDRSPSGLITITGGKLTTYREMAADTVDEVLDLLGDEVAGRVRRRSPTRNLGLRGAHGYDEVRRSRPGGLTASTVEHLADRFGGEATTLFAMIQRDPTLGEPLVEGLPYLRAEALYAARYEMAVTLDDVLTRRTRARLLAGEASRSAAEGVAELIGAELGWSQPERVAQVEAYRVSVDDERDAADLPGVAVGASVGA